MGIVIQKERANDEAMMTISLKMFASDSERVLVLLKLAQNLQLSVILSITRSRSGLKNHASIHLKFGLQR